jgi:peptidoglycan/xylan/chitin deacetylase (PgdA/CDA1 family)
MWKLLEKIINRPILLADRLALVSFTFDDAPLSAFTTGGGILEEHGFRGTYYVSSGLIGKTFESEEIADLATIAEFHQRGHEIANHTNTHLNCKTGGPLRMASNIRKNKKQMKGYMSESFAYPYGSLDAASRCVARICTSSARGIGCGINRGLTDPMNLKAVRIYSRLGTEKCLDLVSECARGGGWLVFYTHDVCGTPSDYGCTPGQMKEVVQAVVRENLPALTVQQAMDIILNKRVLS